MSRKASRSLEQFVKDSKRTACEVCRLPKAVYAEIRGARARRITRSVVLEWLAAEHGITITPAQLQTHYNARHEEE
jgi:hypothetical protein